MNKKKAILFSVGALGTLSVSALSIIGNYFYNLALNPNTSKEAIFGSPEDAKSTSGEIVHEALNWLLEKSNYSDVYIESFDKLKLHGYKILNEIPTDNWVITVHGYTGKGSDMGNYAKNFYDMGYNILIPDLRAHGKSEGSYIGMGWDDRLDILKWIDVIINDNVNSKIILHGISMGAATVSMTSGESLPPNVKVVIADCGYTSVWAQFSHQLKALYSLPDFPIMNASSVVSKFKAGYSLREASVVKQVAKSKTPILFIHGDEDNFVPYRMMDELYNAANCEKEKLTIEGAGHAKASKVNPDLYWATIEKFIKKYLS
ncbi:alpha/beta hydrolase [Clostridium sp. AL.422]|uniref:alpha/beta hydrolase n=1 Tax=Clostridium TaxID=1485 RepID=UPI00293DD588|nr:MULTISPECIES: alpha/beta hydrolase [unclassified Clostridium]MDV4150526.1 alpha/beta hydrolase [Clostridium sp. AL.422]